MASRDWAFRTVAAVAGVLTVHLSWYISEAKIGKLRFSLAPLADVHGFEVLELREALGFERLMLQGKRPTPLHPNEEGHRIAAQHLFETLRDGWQ